jgi:CHAT domain-containing protein
VEKARAVVRLGQALARIGQADDAAARIEWAVTDLDRRGNLGAAAPARAALARVQAARGRTAAARDLATRALAELESAGDRIGAANVLRDLAVWERALGRPEEALRLASRALETPLALGMGLGDEEGAGLRRAARAAADAGLLAIADLAAREPVRAERLCGDAFRLIESSRGLALAEGIENRDALFDAAAAAASREADAAARDRVASMRDRLAELAASPRPDAAALASARADLDAAYRALAESAARVQREARRVAELVYPRPVDLAAVQASLDYDTVLVAFHLTTERAFALAVTKDSVRLADLGFASDLDAAARAYVEVASVAGSDDLRKAEALYERALRPIERETMSRTRIVVSPDGPLAFVPFDALVRADATGTERAIERWEFACVPSATVRHLLAREHPAKEPRPAGVVALGDPDYGDASAPRGAALRAYGRLQRLPGTAAEVRAIEEIAGPRHCTTLLGARATAHDLAEEIAARGGRLAALHLACHGHVDAERPRLTGLVLSHGEVLTADDVLRMRIPAEVVVLSACATGRAPVLRGEGVMGLARAFFFAGASRVVVSNWAVSDDAASEFMSGFARRLLGDHAAARKALRAAKLDLLRSGGPLAHPASWAAFTIWGD